MDNKVENNGKIRTLLIILGLALVGIIAELRCYDWIFEYLKDLQNLNV